MTRRFPLALAVVALLVTGHTRAEQGLDAFARDVARIEGVRAVLNLQRTYAQYAQFGMWNDAGALFTPDATFTFDGLVMPAQTVKGPAAIATFLRTRYGGGKEGLAPDGLSSMFIENPLVNLTPDGTGAKARWDALIYHGHDGKAPLLVDGISKS